MAENKGFEWTQTKASFRHGTQLFGQASDGTGGAGNLPKFNADGSLTDDGICYSYSADTGTANAYAVTLTPTPTLAAGDTVLVNVAHTNTGASTLAISGGTATAVKKEVAGALVDLAQGDWAAGGIYAAVYDGTYWQWIGGGGSNPAWYEEVPAGTLDGANTIYTLSQVPTAGSLTLLMNIVQTEGTDFTLSGNTITFTTAPKPRVANYFLARYQSGGPGSISNGGRGSSGGSATGWSFNETPAGALDGANTLFTLQYPPSPPNALQLYLNGALLNTVSYALAGNAITLSVSPVPDSAAPRGDWLIATYHY